MTKKSKPKISAELLATLVCPITRHPLQYNADTDELVSPSAKVAFPIRDGIPILLADQARRLD